MAHEIRMLGANMIVEIEKICFFARVSASTITILNVDENKYRPSVGVTSLQPYVKLATPQTQL